MNSQESPSYCGPQKRSFNENSPQRNLNENPLAISTISNAVSSNNSGHNVKQDCLFANQNTDFYQIMKQKKEIRKIKKEQKNFQMLQKLSSLPKRHLRSQKMCNDFEENEEGKQNKDDSKHSHVINKEIFEGNQKKDVEYIFQQEQQQQNYKQEHQFQNQFQGQQQCIQDGSMYQNPSLRNNQITTSINENNQKVFNYEVNEQKGHFDHIYAEKNSGFQSSFNQSSFLSYDFIDMEQNQNRQTNNFLMDFEESSQKILLSNIQLNEEPFDQYSQNNNYKIGIQTEDNFQKILESNNFNRFGCEQEQENNIENCEQIFFQANQNMNQQIEKIQMNQNYQKSENNSNKFQKNNAVKNLMSSFKRFILKLFRTESTKVESKDFSENQSIEKKENLEIYFKNNIQIDELLIEATRKIVLDIYNKGSNHKQCFCENVFLQRFENYFKNKSYNQRSLNQLLNQSSFSSVFKYFLNNFASNWLINSSINNYNSYQIMIQFLTME